MRPSDSTFIAVAGEGSDHRIYLLQFDADGKATRFESPAFNLRETTYWVKTLWDGLFARLDLPTLMQEVKMTKMPAKAVMPATEMVGGININQTVAYSAVINDKGQLDTVSALETGPRWIVIQSLQIHLGRKVLSPLLNPKSTTNV